MKYYVSVTEMLCRIVSVNAGSESEAKEKVKNAYATNKIVLDSEDYFEDSAVFTVCEDQEYYHDDEEAGEYYQHID